MDYTEMEKMMEELMQDPMYQQVFWITFIITACVMVVVGIVLYILGAIGVRRLSATAGLSHPALAFVPILRWAMLGRLAELRLPRERKKKKVFAYSVHLPILMTLSTVLEFAYSGYILYYDYLNPEVLPAEQLAGLMSGVSIAFSVIDMIATVVLLMALFRVFMLIGNGSPLLMTLLCALIGFCMPILLFAYRKNTVAPQPLEGEDGDGDDPNNGFYYDGQ
ncbi:MAG: hypothetical protein IJW99_08025 [Clostridia bacterium]|nr:hypothetical protein [Clostridia bacterium]